MAIEGSMATEELSGRAMGASGALGVAAIEPLPLGLDLVLARA
jgi:hypothetical protein